MTSQTISRISALYKRAREGTLTEADILPLSEAVPQRTADFLERILASRPEFDRILKDFGATYDVFRIFTASEVVLDVGAHWGYSVVAMRHQGCPARIVSIEAMTLNTPALERLKSISKGYDFINAAASDSAATVRFYVPTVNRVPNLGLATTGGTLDDNYAKYLASTARSEAEADADADADKVSLVIIDVPANTLDALVGDLPISAIKVDVEGHEGPVVRGARDIISRRHPLFMVEGANRNPVVVSELSGHGYAHYERVAGVLVPQHKPSTHTDGFWLHPSHLDRYIACGLVHGTSPTT